MTDQLKTYTDRRGTLTLAEVNKEVPFPISRIYWIYDVPEGEVRGQHANHISHEYVVAVHGSLDIWLEDAHGRTYHHLDSPTQGLLIPADTWAELYHFSKDAVLMVLASEDYVPEAYVNDYNEFLAYIHR